MRDRVCRSLDWFGWCVLGGLPTGLREPWGPLLRWGPYAWGMALVNRSWMPTHRASPSTSE